MLIVEINTALPLISYNSSLCVQYFDEKKIEQDKKSHIKHEIRIILKPNWAPLTYNLRSRTTLFYPDYSIVHTFLTEYFWLC